jgi:hypothetical protein
MRVTAALCDIHPTITLVPATIEILSPLGDRNMMDTFCCSLPSCHRNYTRNFGYFDFVVRQYLDLADLGTKPRCGWNHHVEYMVLTEIDGVLTWACPVHGAMPRSRQIPVPVEVQRCGRLI